MGFRMKDDYLMDGITTPDALRAHYGAVHPVAARKVLARLDEHARRFIALSPFVVLATGDAEGGVDASPRGDAPGFVAVVDEHTLLLPDRPGNRRVDSYGNVLSHPGVGLLFFVPGINETLRVNGTARVVADAELLAPLTVQGKAPLAGLLITVEEVFFHCAKALIRGRLWDTDTQVERRSFPSLGKIVADQTRVVAADKADEALEEDYRNGLY
jgi:PPOX class probable FMN-dependent enzyme